MPQRRKINSRDKGKRGEREAAKALSEALGVQARRGVQYKGTPESPDVHLDIHGLFVEVKYCERLNVYNALETAAEQSQGNIPVLVWRRKRKPWIFICYLRDLRAFCRMNELRATGREMELALPEVVTGVPPKPQSTAAKDSSGIP
jgi:Holliday junction resolvase